MKENKIALNQFDLARFVKEILKFLNDTGSDPDLHPSYGVSTVACTLCRGRAPDGSIRDRYVVENYGPEDPRAERDIVSELTSEKKLLFFPFSLGNGGEPIARANSVRYDLCLK